MCLISNKPPRILLEDMIVYKGVDALHNGMVASPFYDDFLWTKNKLEETDLVATSCRFYEVGSFYDWAARIGFSSKDEVTCVEEGFHAATTRERLHRSCSTHIAKFLVPKGSTIYEDNSGLLVSDRMVFIELT